jgi:cation-transporting P-type ATPase E
MTPPRRVEDPPPFRSAGRNHVLEALPCDTEGLTGANGLTDAQVAERVRAGLVNDAPERPSRTVGQILAANLLTRFNAIGP